MKECPTCKNCFPDDVVYCPDDGNATAPSIAGEPILDGRYQLEKRLGQGGMGAVFKARHIFLKTQHAIKIILPDLVGNDPMLVTRFRQEALAAAAIRHQNIIAVTDFGVVRGTMPFLVMEFVHGKSLQDIMSEEGAMGPARAFELIQPICSGIAAAHRQNIVHRDLKPLNVMIQQSVPASEGTKILDFGLAKIRSGELLGSFIAAQTTGLMGSPFYMAPEQWGDEPPDMRADVYSLGVMLFQMLSGEVPFKGSSIPAIMKKHLSSEPPTFASKGIEIPPQIEAVVRHALEKEPKYRTSSADEFAKELREAMTSASATLKRTGESAEVDPSKTIVSETSDSLVGASKRVSDPMAGTISGHALLEDEEKTRVAREELAREAEARRLRVEEGERKRKEDDEDRDEERRHLEELVAKQTKVLEEKLTQLAATMSPKGTSTSAADPDATQLHRPGASTVGDNSYQSVPGFSRADISLAGAPRKSSLPIILTVVIVLVLGGSVGGYFAFRNRLTGQPGPPSQPTPTPEANGIRAELIDIPGGEFQMGRNNGPLQEGPAHAVTVKLFAMQKTEVTNAEYLEFVRDAKYEAPSHRFQSKPAFGTEQWPVVNVSVDDANAFASWRSKRDGVTYRLPTEEEWEYAARNGNEDSLYPWGKEFQDGRAVLGEGLPRSVGSFPDGKNRWGVVDLVGNVWEWTSSKVSLYPGNTAAEISPKAQGWFIKRGGSYASNKNDRANPITSTFRDWAPASTRHPTVGFRLVKEGP